MEPSRKSHAIELGVYFCRAMPDDAHESVAIIQLSSLNLFFCIGHTRVVQELILIFLLKRRFDQNRNNDSPSRASSCVPSSCRDTRRSR